MQNKTKNIYPFFFSGYLVSNFFDQFLIFLIPVLVYQSFHDISKSGTIFAIEWLARLLILPFSGSIIDKYGAGKVTILLGFFKSGSFLLVGSLFFLLRSNMFLYLNIIAIVIGIISEICYVSNEVLLLDIFNSEIKESQRISQIIDQIIVISSPGCAAISLNLLSFETIISCIGILSLVNPFILLWIGTENQKSKKASQIFSDMKIGFKLIFNDKRIRRISFLTFFLNLCFGLVVTSLNYFIVTVHGKTEESLAILSLFAAIISTLGLKFIKFKSMGPSFFILWSLLFLLCFCFINIKIHLFLFFIVYSLFSLSVSQLTLFIRSERIKLAPKKHLGKLVGCMIFLNSCSMPIAGYLIHLFGTSNFTSLWMVATFLLILAIAFSIKSFFTTALFSTEVPP